ncbi:MAG: DKNYY domain-containing protein [Meiothermus sp.]|nr:DKNYY domain-containing protein [Meiothermus sp.]
MGRAMKGLGAVMLGLISLLTGCGSKEPYQQRGGTWYYRDQPLQLQPGERLTPLSGEFARSQRFGYFRGLPISGSDGGSFVVLDGHYAKDRQQVYYCFARRESEDYFTTQRRVVKVLEADPTNFQLLRRGYAKDKQKVFYEGTPFAVRDVASFELLDYGLFARDRFTGYYDDIPIPGSDGPSFTPLDDHYARDRAHVYFADKDLSQSPIVARSWRLEGALLDSFKTLESSYAKDAQRAYYKGKPLSVSDGGWLEVLSLGYAKTQTRVFYEGKEVRGADAASFAMLQPITDQADSRDAKYSYKQGQRVNN